MGAIQQGSGQTLSEAQEATVRQVICDKRPEQLQMAFAFWNRAVIDRVHQKLSMIATIANQSKTRWMIIDEAFNSDKLIKFLEALIKDVGRTVFLILDNLRVHHSKAIKKWAEEHKEKIELRYLPSYSPELNPEERLNTDLKHAVSIKVSVRTKDKLKAAATEHMQALEKSPERIKKCFQNSRVKYAS